MLYWNKLFLKSVPYIRSDGADIGFCQGVQQSQAFGRLDFGDKVVPRHMVIIYDINDHLMKKVGKLYPGNVEKMRPRSLNPRFSYSRRAASHFSKVQNKM